MAKGHPSSHWRSRQVLKKGHNKGTILSWVNRKGLLSYKGRTSSRESNFMFLWTCWYQDLGQQCWKHWDLAEGGHQVHQCLGVTTTTNDAKGLQSTWNSQSIGKEIRKDEGIKLGLDTSPLHDTNQISTTSMLMYYLFPHITTLCPISPLRFLRFCEERIAVYTGFQQSRDNVYRAFGVVLVSSSALLPDLQSNCSSGEARKHSLLMGWAVQCDEES